MGIALAGTAKATCTPTPPLTQSYYPPAADCSEYKIPVTIKSENTVLGLPVWKDDYELESFLTSATTRALGPPPGPGPTVVETATYEIAASFCTPKRTNGKEKTVIFATHGIGQARSHWNSPYKPEEYNFVQYAIAQGYSVFFYDRLGAGDSQK